MKPLLRRRTVYAATLVGMLVVISGFTFASGLFGGFAGTGGQINGNQATITGHGTIYANGVSSSSFTDLITTTTGTSCNAQTDSYAPTTTPTTYIVNAWVGGNNSACTRTTVPDYVMQLNFTSTNLTAGSTLTDQFVITAEFGSATHYSTNTTTITCKLTTTETYCQANINIDTGVPNTELQPLVQGIQVTITGN